MLVYFQEPVGKAGNQRARSFEAHQGMPSNAVSYLGLQVVLEIFVLGTVVFQDQRSSLTCSVQNGKLHVFHTECKILTRVLGVPDGD